MKNTILVLLFLFCSASMAGQSSIKPGVYNTYRAFENNKPSGETSYVLMPFIRVNKLDHQYNDTLYRLAVDGNEGKKVFAVFDAGSLYINTEDSLYRKMEYAGRFPFATVTNKYHFEEGFVIVNKTPIWKEERDEVFTYIAFVNRQGKLVNAEFETMWAFLKNDNDLSKQFGKEKYVNETYRKYILLMNQRYPL